MVKEPRPLEEVLPIVVVGNLNYPVLCSCIMSATLGFASRMLMVTKVPTKQPLKGLGILHDSLTWTLQIDQVTDQWLLEGHQTWPCTWAFPALWILMPALWILTTLENVKAMDSIPDAQRGYMSEGNLEIGITSLALIWQKLTPNTKYKKLLNPKEGMFHLLVTHWKQNYHPCRIDEDIEPREAGETWYITFPLLS